LLVIELLKWILWGSAATVVFITLGYPVFLFLVGLLVRRRRTLGDSLPHVSLVICAYNEESVIEQKLNNSLALDYPRDRLDIHVASDGSTDRTNGIVESFAARGVVLDSFGRTGKTGMQNQMARRARGDILVFSDANADYRPDAIRKLVRNFADPAIGAVCGQLNYTTAGEGAGASEDLYWRYEKFMKQRESDISSIIGANGSIYAVRKSDYVELDPGTISDLVEPLAIVRAGKRVVYEPEAVSTEEGSVSYGTEFRRKVRILTRSIGGLLSMSALFNPFRFGVFSLQIILHKLMRFLTPVFLICGAVSLALLGLSGHYVWLLAAAVAGTVLSIVIVSRGIDLKPRILARLFHAYYYYLMANYALVLAWVNIAKGNRMKLWVPERPQA
jgi:cellulose synthase/poly-beta-1,6-N-acetylglucosamine synthase-like glycosyltransferase